MKIVEMLKPEYIIEALQSDKKRDVLLELSAPFLKDYPKLDPDVALAVLMEAISIVASTELFSMLA